MPMDENKFKMLFSILKMMEDEDIGKGSIENTIIKVIDSSEEAMTEEQKGRVYKEFTNYISKRKQLLKSAERSAHLEEERYKESLKDFSHGKEFLGW